MAAQYQQRRKHLSLREEDEVSENKNNSKNPKKKKDSDGKRSGFEIVGNIVKLAWPRDKKLQTRLLGSFSCLVLGKAATIYTPLALGKLINELSERSVASSTLNSSMLDTIGNSSLDMFSLSSPEMLPFWLLCSYGMSKMSGSLFNEFRTYLFSSVVQNACRHASLDVFRHLHKLEVDYLLKLKGGEVQAIMNRALKSMQSVMTTMLFTIGPTLLEFSFVVGIFGIKMGLTASAIVIATFGTYFVFTVQYSNMRRELMKRTNRYEDRMAGILVDSITNCEAVRYFGSRKYEAKRYDHVLAEYEKSQVEVLKTLAILNFGQQFVINAGLLSIMGMATVGVLNGTMEVGTVVAMNTLMLQLSQPLHFLGGAYRMVLQGVVDVEKLDKFLKQKPTGTLLLDSSSSDNINVPYVYRGGEIELKDVNFRALKNVNMVIPPGSKVGICGPSGSGKSTLLKLISGVAGVPDSGHILVDKQHLSSLDVESYVKHLGIVPQEPVLFNDSLLFNLRYANQDASFEQIEDACRMAQVHDVIEKHLEDGYATRVGERGTRLSGGERQRIAIARCLLRNPDILLFDEATASLDLETEARLTAAINNLLTETSSEGSTTTKLRTMVIVAHRLSTIRKCDQIFYIEDGEILEMGSHEELISLGGNYKRLWDLNLSTDQDVTGDTGCVVGDK